MLPEHEWEEFMSALRRELPSTFRITGNKRYFALNPKLFYHFPQFFLSVQKDHH